MSSYIEKTKNFCANQVQYGISSLKKKGSEFVHSKLVQSSIEKASFVGGFALMQTLQYCFGKHQLDLPKIVNDKIINGTHQDLDHLIGIASSETLNKVASPILAIADPIKKGVMPDPKSAQELVSKHSFPKEILNEQFKDFRTFVLNSRLHIPISYYKHAVIFDSQQNDILLLVDGQYVKSQDILRNFRLENRAPVERMFLPPIFVHKNNKQRYAYLENGLTLHDVEKDIRPYQVLPNNQRPYQPLLKFKFSIDSEVESPEDLNDFSYHAWCEVVLPSGKCYSFGLYGKGIVQCPDPGSFGEEKGIRSVAFPISEEKVLEIFVKIHALRDNADWDYHFTQYNCASFITEIGKIIGIDIDDKDEIKRFDGIITRIKMYAISSILASLLRDPDVISKIGTCQELANVTKKVQDLPLKLQELFSNFSLDTCFESVLIGNTLQNHTFTKNQILQAYSVLQVLIRALDLRKLYPEMPDALSEIRQLCRSLLSGSQRELTYKIYNLLDQIVSQFSEYKVHSPGFVYERVVEEKKKLKKPFTPMTIL